MPIRLNKKLPAYQILQDKGVFVMDIARAQTQDIRPLRIGLLNLMPKKQETEAQIFSMIGDTPLQVDPILIRTASYSPKNVSQSHLEDFYITFDEAKPDGLDGLIITGAPVEQIEFEQVAYWEELKHIMNWADKKIASTLYLCWGAQAGLYYHHGIGKYDLSKKKFGVFKHTPSDTTDTLLKDIDDEYWVPHSRHTEVRESDVQSIPQLEILSKSDDAGLHLVANKSRTQVYQFGHPEYDPQTLKQEYERDKSKGLEIDMPKNYFLNDDDGDKPHVRWRANAAIFYRNWINHVYQTTPYDLKTGQFNASTARD